MGVPGKSVHAWLQSVDFGNVQFVVLIEKQIFYTEREKKKEKQNIGTVIPYHTPYINRWTSVNVANLGQRS